MEFEFDSAKSMSNLAKHGISFNDAKQAWRDPRLLLIQAARVAEERWIAIALLERKHWSVVFTYRDGRIRIISARRSRAREIALYES
jgi:uncharacterized DUF497 family protein